MYRRMYTNSWYMDRKFPGLWRLLAGCAGFLLSNLRVGFTGSTHCLRHHCLSASKHKKRKWVHKHYLSFKRLNFEVFGTRPHTHFWLCTTYSLYVRTCSTLLTGLNEYCMITSTYCRNTLMRS